MQKTRRTEIIQAKIEKEEDKKDPNLLFTFEQVKDISKEYSRSIRLGLTSEFEEWYEYQYRNRFSSGTGTFSIDTSLGNDITVSDVMIDTGQILKRNKKWM